MFDFIGDLVSRIAKLVIDLIFIAIIVGVLVLLYMSIIRHERNPYGDHSKELTKMEQELDRNAEYKRALQSIHDERANVFEDE